MDEDGSNSQQQPQPVATPATASTPFLCGMSTKLRPLLKLNDDLRVLLEDDRELNVSTIIVVGDQSHGKTSVVEALSGIDLPRGEGIQTRVPLELRMRHARADEEERAILEVAGDNEPPTSVNLSEIGDIVRRKTDEIAPGKSVVDKPLFLTVYKHDHEDLTLIDLPGMTRVAAQNQSSNIGAEITAMYKKYMEIEETIMLNIVNAGVDYSTSQALAMSIKADPNHERTFVCLTKVDKVDDGSLSRVVRKITESLQGIKVFAVRNRTQDENEVGMSLEDAREQERRCLQQLPNLNPSMKGIHALSKELVRVQTDRMQKTLPGLREKVCEALRKTEEELRSLPNVPQSSEEGRGVVRQVIGKIMQDLRAQVTGDLTQRGVAPPCNNAVITDSDRVEVSWQRNELGVARDINGTNITLKAGNNSTLTLSFNDSAHVFLMGYNSKLTQEQGGDEVFTQVFQFPHKRSSNTISLSPNFASCQYFHAVVDVVRISSVTQQQQQQQLQQQQQEAEASLMLCATLANLEQNFARQLRRHHLPLYFVAGRGFKTEVTNLVTALRGGVGLPNTISPTVAVTIINNEQRGLKYYIDAFIEKAYKLIEAKINAAVEANSKNLDSLKTALLHEVAHALQQQRQSLEEAVTLLLDMEKRIGTQNHYFMDTFNNMRKQYCSDNDGDDGGEDHLSDRSNEEQAITDLRLSIAAYWKLSCKRIIDNITQVVHLKLAQDLIVSPQGLEKQWNSSLDKEGKDIQFLATPCMNTKVRVDDLTKRKITLKKALQRIAQESNLF